MFDLKSEYFKPVTTFTIHANKLTLWFIIKVIYIHICLDYLYF